MPLAKHEFTFRQFTTPGVQGPHTHPDGEYETVHKPPARPGDRWLDNTADPVNRAAIRSQRNRSPFGTIPPNLRFRRRLFRGPR